MARKPRPLQRDTNSLRDDRLFIVACDDTYAPKQYFSFFKISRVQIHVIETPKDTNACHASYVLERLKDTEYNADDERWLLLDTDHYIQGSHLSSFNRTLKEAEESGIHVALSRPCFELWLLLHHLSHESVSDIANAKDAERLLRDTLAGYNKCQLKQQHFSLLSVSQACCSAKILDQNQSRIPSNNTSRVYRLWQAIVEGAQPSQLPIELQALKIQFAGK